MDGKQTGWDRIMKLLEKACRENAIADAKDLGITIAVYKKLWFASYAVLAIFNKPTYNEVRNLVRATGSIAKLIDHCKLTEQQEYRKEEIDLLYRISSEGISSTSITVAKREAMEPLSPASIFHLFKKIICYFHNVFIFYLICGIICKRTLTYR